MPDHVDTSAVLRAATVEELKTARELLADPTRWTQRVYARDERGRKILPEDARAVCWCAWGALLRQNAAWRACFIRGTCGGVHLIQAAHELFGFQPSVVNDHCDHAAVLRMYDRAIEFAEGRPS